MRGIFPDAPILSSAASDERPVCEWVMPAFIPQRDYGRKRVMLPPGMPDCIEVHAIHSEEGIERSTAVIYGAYAYLIHYEFKRRA